MVWSMMSKGNTTVWSILCRWSAFLLYFPLYLPSWYTWLSHFIVMTALCWFRLKRLFMKHNWASWLRGVTEHEHPWSKINSQYNTGSWHIISFDLQLVFALGCLRWQHISAERVWAVQLAFVPLPLYLKGCHLVFLGVSFATVWKSPCFHLRDVSLH